MKKILIIEDEEAMRQGLDDLLRSSGYESKALDLSKYLPQPQNIASIIDDIVAVQADLILLDLNLAGLPVIMVTSSGMEMDEVLSMSYGADDYITKPYNPQILLLRIAAVLKRFEGTNGPIKFHNLRVDLNKGVIESDQKRILLTKNEMIIFGHLLSHRGEIVTRDDLMTDLWNNHEYINVSRLRGKFKTLGMGETIETRKGLGYILS